MALIPKLRRRGSKDPSGSMTIVEHLEELRYRLVVSLGAIGVASIAGWFLYGPVTRLLIHPYCEYWDTVPAGERVTGDCTLFFTGAIEAVLIKLKVVGFLGLLLAIPVVLY